MLETVVFFCSLAGPGAGAATSGRSVYLSPAASFMVVCSNKIARKFSKILVISSEHFLCNLTFKAADLIAP
jgi:hypothetical protein